MNVLMVIKTQSFMSTGSFLGKKFIERFAGSRQKTIREVCQNCFLSAFIGKGTIAPYF